MNVYNYHPISGALLSESTADESPLEPGVFLIPAYATMEVPPVCSETQQLIFSGGAWFVEETPQIVPEPETLPAEVKAMVWGRIKAERDRRSELGGCIVDGRWYDIDQKSAIRYKYMADKAAAMGAGDSDVIRSDWRPMDYDISGSVDMTYGMLKQIMDAGIDAGMAIDDAAQVHKIMMEASPDPINYDFSVGWPVCYGD